jgi:hypothetical protein
LLHILFGAGLVLRFDRLTGYGHLCFISTFIAVAFFSPIFHHSHNLLFAYSKLAIASAAFLVFLPKMPEEEYRLPL